jgi:hypothetical protein
MGERAMPRAQIRPEEPSEPPDLWCADCRPYAGLACDGADAGIGAGDSNGIARQDGLKIKDPGTELLSRGRGATYLPLDEREHVLTGITASSCQIPLAEAN